MTRRFKEFDRSAFFGEVFKVLLPKMHVHMATGDEWHAHRRLISETMSPAFLNQVAAPQMWSQMQSLIKLWREKARLAFQDSLDKMHLTVEKYGIEKPTIQIRAMKARWGSCIRDKNSIMLNYDLIRAPKFCIDYVVLHELLHFRHGRHDAEFYNFLAMLMPDWKQRKAMLDGEVVSGS